MDFHDRFLGVANALEIARNKREQEQGERTRKEQVHQRAKATGAEFLQSGKDLRDLSG